MSRPHSPQPLLKTVLVLAATLGYPLQLCTGTKHLDSLLTTETIRPR